MGAPEHCRDRPLCLSKGSGAIYRTKGFTLIELLFVIVIIAITLGVSNPILRDTFDDIKLKTASQDIAGLIRYAQEQAIVKNAVIRLNIDSERQSYWLSQKNKNEEASDKEAFSEEKLSGRFGRTFYLSEGLTIECLPAGRQGLKEAIDFQPDGQPDEAVIKLSNAKGKAITISLTPNVGDCISIDEK